MKKLPTVQALNWTQFLGAFNDNLFKFLTIFMAIEIWGEDNSGSILPIAGALSTIPFLIFSDAGGVIADRRSKSEIIKFIKLMEIVIMSIGFIGFLFGSPVFVLITLFLMSAQSAYFGPAKYGIIPELVTEEKLPQANATIAAMTFGAIILGTVVASVVNVFLPLAVSSLLTILIAVAGYIISAKIPHVEAVGTNRSISPLFFNEAWKTLRSTMKNRYLYASIIALSFFWMLGAFIQLEIIPFGTDILKVTKENANYLFLCCSFGIGLGSFIAGKISGEKIKLGLVAWACGGLLASVFFLSQATTVVTCCLALFGFGVFAGIYSLPLNSYIQWKSPDSSRGKILAAVNFFNFTGILSAAGVMAAFDHYGFNAAKNYFLIAVGLLIFAVVMFIRFPEFYRTYRMAKHRANGAK